MKKLFVLLSLVLALAAGAQYIRLSQEPQATSAAASDDLLLNQWTGSNYITKRITFTNFVAVGISGALRRAVLAGVPA